MEEENKISKPWIHSKSSARKFGGTPEPYLKIHNFLDSSKSHFSDNRHRALLHHSFGIFIAEQVFGVTITNSEGNEISVRDIAEMHVLEDYSMRFIPTVQDYLEHLEHKDWMSNLPGGIPSSNKKIAEKQIEMKKIIRG